MYQKEIKQLYYITNVKNIPSILEKGILSHRNVLNEKIEYHAIYDENIISNREKCIVENQKTLWDYANLYFQPRNPMLYRVICNVSKVEDIVVLAIDHSIMSEFGVMISDGNAASYQSNITEVAVGLKDINSKTIRTEWWNDADGSKRRIMAECLVPEKIPPQYIISIYCASYSIKENLQNIVKQYNERINVIPELNMFFQSTRTSVITDKLFVVEGDMFFSRMQTLTVSVNCKGIMGKGLASRAKYQFPDIYVFYQDACRRGQIKLGKPYLYKRESSFDVELADEPMSLVNGNAETWFLLFATKDDWKNNADRNGIEEGLKWIVNNYKKEGIKTLALPALGCGLGNLKWEDIGPLMCKYLSTIDIQVKIYLPTEKKMPDEQISKQFLLSK
ncbi:MAG: DarT ssDNA thymidine ADP-ribosyltransferase family protein [Elusimicrobiota bacterium]